VGRRTPSTPVLVDIVPPVAMTVRRAMTGIFPNRRGEAAPNQGGR
jgi:hypothetical protein